MSDVKLALTFEQQLEHLEKDLNLIIENKQKAKTILARTNYYRLIDAYSIGLYTDSTKSQYRSGVSFFQIYDLYQFDEELRHKVSELIEDFEIRFRTAVAYYISIKYGPLAYLDRGTFEKETFYEDFLNCYEREKKSQGKSLIVKHHNEKYEGNIPIWAAVEILSFGTVSKLYKNLKREDRIIIARQFKTDYKHLNSWLRSFVEVRNICAHYGRLYNKPLLFPPSIYKDQKEVLPREDRIFSVLYILKRYISQEKMLSTALTLHSALARHKSADLSLMGFPENWEYLLTDID